MLFNISITLPKRIKIDAIIIVKGMSGLFPFLILLTAPIINPKIGQKEAINTVFPTPILLIESKNRLYAMPKLKMPCTANGHIFLISLARLNIL